VLFTGEVTSAYVASTGPGYRGPNEAEKDVGTTMTIGESVSVPYQEENGVKICVGREDNTGIYAQVVLNDRISWKEEDGAKCWEYEGRQLATPYVRGQEPAGLRFNVKKVYCYEVNAGSPGSFWYVSVQTELHDTDGKTWRLANDSSGNVYGGKMIYQGIPEDDEAGFASHGKKLTEDQARWLVDALEIQGSVCPAYWYVKHGF